MKPALERYFGLSTEVKERILSFERMMRGMPFSEEQVDNMIQWKLKGDEVFINRYINMNPNSAEDVKRMERMFLEDKETINDEGYRVVKPLQREFAYHVQDNGIGVTFIAVRCKIK